MKKNNKKGFVLAETIAVSVIIMTSLVIVYTQFATLNNSYKTSFQYNNVNNLYLVNNLRNFIKDDGLDKLIQLLDNNEYVDITSCPSYLFDEYLYCRLLVDNSNMKTILFTNEDISKLKNSIDSTNYSQTMKNYIKKINNSTGNSQRLIVEFEDETYATILFVFNEEDDFAMAPVEFDYTGSERSFTVPHSGYYKLEAWGAQGGSISGDAYNSSNALRESNVTYYGGKGAYTTGQIYLNEGTILYIHVGGTVVTNSSSTCNITGGYNGGASISSSTQCIYGAPGGGATDIRIVSGSWDDFSSLKSRIMVAAGGGGANFRNYGYGEGNGGEGGELTGINGYESMKPGSYFRADYSAGYMIGKGGTQTTGGYPIQYFLNGQITEVLDKTASFGGLNNNEILSQTGGGGGYYNGGVSGHGGGGGGSSFISGYSGCDAISENSTSTNIIHTGQPNHYSGYVFVNSRMIAGNKEMPAHDGVSTMIGNQGNGYAKITYVGETI